MPPSPVPEGEFGAAVAAGDLDDEDDKAVDAFVTVQLALRDALMAGSQR
jgi:hypothetical protein